MFMHERISIQVLHIRNDSGMTTGGERRMGQVVGEGGGLMFFLLL